MARVLSTTAGTRPDAFAARDWFYGISTALMWGSAFYFIAVALDELAPGVVTAMRVGLGALTVILLPDARRPVDTADWPRIVVLGFCWVAFPFTLFPIAQQWIDSSLAGMLIGSMPIMAAFVTAVLLRSLPGGRQIVGLIVGFAGVLAIGWPALGQADSTALGAALVLLAVAFYAIAATVSVPLVQRYGSIPVMARTLATAAIMCVPFGLWGLQESSFSWSAVSACIVLGVGATGLAFVTFTNLTSRVGSTRGTSINYFVPVVAVVFGVGLRNESVALISLVGVGLVLAGAYLVSGRERRAHAART